MNANDPVYPIPNTTHLDERIAGITLRDHIAIEAMNAWISSWPENQSFNRGHFKGVADVAYEMADAMLERSQK